MKFIQHYELSGNQASIVFSNIPQTYTDLVVFYSLRHTSVAVDPGAFYFNTDSGPNYNMRLLLGDGSGTGSFSNANYLAEYNNWSSLFLVPSGATANTFGSIKVYISDYSSNSKHKTVSTDCVNANNSSSSFVAMSTGVWKNNSPINAITFSSSTGLLAQFSSASLYGIKAGSSGGVTVS